MAKAVPEKMNLTARQPSQGARSLRFARGLVSFWVRLIGASPKQKFVEPCSVNVLGLDFGFHPEILRSQRDSHTGQTAARTRLQWNAALRLRRGDL